MPCLAAGAYRVRRTSPRQGSRSKSQTRRPDQLGRPDAGRRRRLIVQTAPGAHGPHRRRAGAVGPGDPRAVSAWGRPNTPMLAPASGISCAGGVTLMGRRLIRRGGEDSALRVNRGALERNREAMDDDKLISAIADGGAAGLRELFSRHAPWLAAADVEDVLQETFLAVWRGARGYRPADQGGAAGAWLWGIARRQAALLL